MNGPSNRDYHRSVRPRRRVKPPLAAPLFQWVWEEGTGAGTVLKTIQTQSLKAGMYVVKLHGPWLQHPFWRTRFVVDQDDVDTLLASPVDRVDIDTDRGGDVDAAGNEDAHGPMPCADDAALVLAAGLPPKSGGAQAHAGMGDELARARLICDDGRALVEAMFGELRMGRTIVLDGARDLAARIDASVSRNPLALVSLARLKTADDYTYLHSVAVAGLMSAVARDLALPEQQRERAAIAGLLHDMGKAHVPLAILNKPGKLLDEEMALMRDHPAAGERLLRDAGLEDADVLHVVRHHHERMDGNGYPDRLAAEDLPVLTRISAVCDVYDAITSNRPYKAGWDPAESLRRMASWQGHFDPLALKSLVRVLGIYPVGSLVRLASDLLAVVVAPGDHPLAPPRVRIFFSARSRSHVFRRDVDLGASSDHIVGIESAHAWGFRDLEKLWMP